MQKFAGRGLRGLFQGTGLAKLCLSGLLGLMVSTAWAQPANDNFTNAFVITGLSGTTNGSNVGATLENVSSCESTILNTDDFADVDNSVWFAWTAPTNGTVSFDTMGSGFDTVLAVYTTPSDLCDINLSLVAGNDDINYPVNTNSQVSFSAVAGTTYYVSVDGNADTFANIGSGDSGNYLLNWSMSAIPSIASGTFRFTRRRQHLWRHAERDIYRLAPDRDTHGAGQRQGLGGLPVHDHEFHQLHQLF
jgi:hypothetical protein